MKVLICDDSQGSTAHYFIRLGLARGFAAGGHDVRIWQLGTKSALDWFDEFKPDIFYGMTYQIDKSLIRALEEYPNCKVFMKGADWSPFSDALDLNKYPVLTASKTELKMVEELRKRTGKPDFIDIHYHHSRVEQTHSYWRDKMGIPIKSVMPAADIIDYVGGKVIPELQSDITHISGYWPYKAQVIDKWFLPLCEHTTGLNIKIFGNKNWGVPQYCGNIDTQYVKHAFKSARLNINLSEPHAQTYGYELNEKVFKLLAGNNTVLSDYTESLAKDVFPDGVEYAKTPEEFKQKALAILNGEIIVDHQIGYNTVMSKHTYIHRASEIFQYLNMEKESRDLLDVYTKLRQENDI